MHVEVYIDLFVFKTVLVIILKNYS